MPAKIMWIRGVAVTLLAFAAFSGAALAASLGTSQTVESTLRAGMTTGSGGSDGYYLEQVGGPVLLASNDSLAYDPASALKTLIAAFALKQGTSMTTAITEFAYPNSRNAGGNPSNPNLCPDAGDENASNASTKTLQQLLAEMLLYSDNRATRALELYFGRNNIAAYASSLGMGNTRYNQIIGCGADGGVQNAWTLDDAGRLYEAIAASNWSTSLYGNMLKYDNQGFAGVVRDEASNLGVPDAASSLTAGLVSHYKGGSYNICSGSCGAQDVITQDQAGILTVPFQTPAGVKSVNFVWGTFISGLNASCPQLDFPGGSCPASDAAGAAVNNSVPEIFRAAIHAALQSWAAKTALQASTGSVSKKTGKVHLTAHLRTAYGGHTPAGMTVSFTINKKLLCRAKTNSTGIAACTVKAPKGKVKAFSANFAGTSTYFPATANARVITVK